MNPRYALLGVVFVVLMVAELAQEGGAIDAVARHDDQSVATTPTAATVPDGGGQPLPPQPTFNTNAAAVQTTPSVPAVASFSAPAVTYSPGSANSSPVAEVGALSKSRMNLEEGSPTEVPLPR